MCAFVVCLLRFRFSAKHFWQCSHLKFSLCFLFLCLLTSARDQKSHYTDHKYTDGIPSYGTSNASLVRTLWYMWGTSFPQAFLCQYFPLSLVLYSSSPVKTCLLSVFLNFMWSHINHNLLM